MPEDWPVSSPAILWLQADRMTAVSATIRDMRRVVTRAVVVTLLVLGTATGPSRAQQADPEDHPDIKLFLQATAQDGSRAEDALRKIGARWRVGYAAIIWDLARFVRPPRPQLFQFFRVVDFLQ